MAGTRNGLITINDNATGSPQTVSLSGTGLTTTSVNLTSSLNPSKYGQGVTFTAVVIPGGPGTLAGNVTFYDGSTALGSVSLRKPPGKRLHFLGISEGSNDIDAESIDQGFSLLLLVNDDDRVKTTAPKGE
jgi:hypothetical protein